MTEPTIIQPRQNKIYKRKKPKLMGFFYFDVERKKI